MNNAEEKAEESFCGWRETWDLDNMTPAEIYKAGFHNGMTQSGKQSTAAAVAAIEYATTHDEGIQFLRAWLVGDFNTIRAEWPDVPDEVFPK